jgi:inner membrane protein
LDSVTQFVLGASVGVAAMGRRTAPWKAALWGGIAGTLPDLDVVIDYGDPIRNMTFHRGESHAFFYLTLFSPILAWLVSRLHGETDRFKRWWLALWLALVTHPMLDFFTVYGTQLLLPFTDRPFGLGSVFIIDPLYTVPLIVGVIAALALRSIERGLAWNRATLVLSCTYLAWTVAAQAYVTNVARESLREQGIAAERVLVTPTAFNSVLWRVVAMERERYHEGYYSLVDAGRRVGFDAFPHDAALHARIASDWPVARIASFSKGFFRTIERPGGVHIADLRMGAEPNYTFEFVVARRASPELRAVTPEAAGGRGDVRRWLAWTWRRMWGAEESPPRG